MKKKPSNSDGDVLNGVSSGASFFGMTEKAMYGKVARNLVPYRRWGGKIIFIKSELIAFLETLEGCSADEAIRNLHQRNSRRDGTELKIVR